MEYKKIYEPEELQEIVAWARKNMHRMPKSLKLDDSAFIEDLHYTMDTYCEICEEHKLNPTYGAQIRHIFMMRDKLLADNLLLPEDTPVEDAPASPAPTEGE